MRYIRSFLLFSFAILILSAFDVKAQTIANSPRALEDKIYKRILNLPYYGVFDNIKFQLNGSTVTLTGKVYSLGLKSSAERAVKNIEGISEVINKIENLPPSSFDNQIRFQLLREYATRGGNFYRYLQEPNPSVRIIVENGRVTLEGYVTYRSDSDLASILANGIPGVFQVTNNLVVTREMLR